MLDFLKKKIISTSCNCSIRKNAIFYDTFKYPFSNTKESKVDILILLEFQETEHRTNSLKNAFFSNFKDYTFAVIPALGCTPKNFKLDSDTISMYTQCKKENIKKLIEQYSPKVIITSGRSLYTITESKDLKPYHFFVPIGGALQEYQKDDTWIYSSEFNCKVFSIPPIYQYIDYKGTFKDVYETKFFFEQLNRTKEVLKERKERKSELKLLYEKEPNNLIQSYLNNTNKQIIAIDTETSGLNYFEDELYSIQFSNDGVTGSFCVFQSINKELLNELFSKKDIIFVFHHAQFDLKMLKSNGIYNARCDFDTMLASHSLNENSPNGLKSLTWLYTIYGGYELKLQEYFKKYKIDNFLQAPQQILLEYACMDVIITRQLYDYFVKRFELDDISVKENFYNFVMPAVEMITDIEMTGVQIDFNYLKEYVNKLKQKVNEIENNIYKIAGKSFNLKSSKELTEVLKKIPEFKILKDDKGKELLTKNGDLVLNKEVLERYVKEQDHEFLKQIIEYNHITKEISQFGYSIKKEKKNNKKKLFEVEEEIDNEKGFLASIYNGRLYGGYKLHGTETGRMSGGGGLGSTINWQNMPKTPEFRKIFLAPEGYVIAYSDYDGMEVSIYSQIAGKGPLENVILSGKDPHCYTCISLFKLLENKNISYEEIFSKTKIEGQEDKHFKQMRTNSKTLNFQGLYGATKYGLANSFGVEIEAGEKYLNAFYQSYPEIEKYIKYNRSFAQKNGYVKTLLGRKRRLPELTYIGEDSYKNKDSFFNLGNLMNAALNAPVQGTSGQTTLIAMTNIWKEFKKKNVKTRIIINVHDEIVFELYIPEIQETEKIIKYWMEYPYYKNIAGNEVKLTAGLEYGEIWKYAHSTKYWNEHKEEFEIVKNNINERNQKNLH